MFHLLLATTSDPISVLYDFLTNPQYDAVRTALRELGGFLAGVASAIGGSKGLQELLNGRKRVPETPTNVEMQQSINRWLMTENARMNAQIALKESECEDLSEQNAHLRGINETLRAIANEDEIPPPI